MPKRPTSTTGASESGAQDVARVERLRWWLVLAVLIVGYDFARVTVATLSGGGLTAHAATAVPLPSTNPKRPVTQAPDPTTVPPQPDASGELPPTAIGTAAAADIHAAESAASGDRDRAAHAHPVLWQGQLVIGSAIWTCRRLEELPDQLQEALAREWASATAESHAARAGAGDPSRSRSQEVADRAFDARSTSIPPTRLLLRNRTGTGSVVHFLVDERSYALFPGEELELPGRRWIVRFHRGGDFGDAGYSLWPGSYEFFLTSRGWDLMRRDLGASARTP